ncbi:hypothetical protein [Nocardia asiatica]|uniref:hypothetical protein n=1 Tax=Nocardia asiatica TaxID=209252 RepID=UPI003EDF3797
MTVIIGMDPHKRSATVEMVDQSATVLATGRYSTDTAGYIERTYHRRRRQRRLGRLTPIEYETLKQAPLATPRRHQHHTNRSTGHHNSPHHIPQVSHSLQNELHPIGDSPGQHDQTWLRYIAAGLLIYRCYGEPEFNNRIRNVSTMLA